MNELDDWIDDEEDEEQETLSPTVSGGASEKSIERHFESGRLRVVQDRNDFFLPHVVDFLEERKWGNLNPEYQRRLRWSIEKKSKLIESFIMNVPVPSVFLFENTIGRFEVMDGQQRLNTIREFIKNDFELTGLKIWTSLNGRSFSKLPPLVRRGIERAKISAITLMSDDADISETAIDLRAQVFERLNTGGERLNPQELRNSLYSGRFNRLIVKLAQEDDFTKCWDIPSREENTLSDGTPTISLRENNLFKRMIDVEIVLRFFAFMDLDEISGSVRSMLDNTMKKYRNLPAEEAVELQDTFLRVLRICRCVFGNDVFRLPGARRRKGKLSRPLYDAEMVAIYLLEEHEDDIIYQKDAVKNAVLELAMPQNAAYQLIVGRANTAAALQGRITAVRDAIYSVL